MACPPAALAYADRIVQSAVDQVNSIKRTALSYNNILIEGIRGLPDDELDPSAFVPTIPGADLSDLPAWLSCSLTPLIVADVLSNEPDPVGFFTSSEPADQLKVIRSAYSGIVRNELEAYRTARDASVAGDVERKAGQFWATLRSTTLDQELLARAQAFSEAVEADDPLHWQAGPYAEFGTASFGLTMDGLVPTSFLEPEVRDYMLNFQVAQTKLDALRAVAS